MVTTHSPDPPHSPSTVANTPPASEFDSDAEEFTLVPEDMNDLDLDPGTGSSDATAAGDSATERTTWYERGFELSTGKVVKQITRGFSIKFIAVMGLSGTGKSSLIRRLTGCEVHVGDNLEAGTTTFAMYATTISSQRYIFIDTPGFDDAQMTDEEVFSEIMKWFRTMTPYVTLSGILYLHPITDFRLRGNAELNLRFLRELSGEEFFPNITFVTTMWDGLNDSRWAKAEKTERQLREKPWREFIDAGADMQRFVDSPNDLNDTQTAARNIVERFKTVERKVRPKIQLELKKRVPIEKTRAARVLAGNFGEPEVEDEKEREDEAPAVREETRQVLAPPAEQAQPPQTTNLNVKDLHIYAENLHLTKPPSPAPPYIEVKQPPPPPPPKKSWWSSLVSAIRSFFTW